jgi:hypothetical protein
MVIHRKILNLTAEVEKDVDQLGLDVRAVALGRHVRLAGYLGTPPGSKIGFWRTSIDDLRGVNFRLGRQYTGPCLTLLLHTRPERES